MVKVKSVVVVAMMLIAAGAMASNFRAGDQIYVPAAGHLAGSSGTFISDMFISNLSSDPVSVSVIYAAGTGGTQQNFSNVISLLANERQEVLDIFPTKLGLATGFGQLIFNACRTGGNCTTTEPGRCPGFAGGVCPDFRNISVESRIYSIPPGSIPATAPTTGQLFSGIPWYNFVSSDTASVGLDKVFITGLRNTGAAGTAGTYRGNIGLVNASQYSTTTLVARLFDGRTGAQIGSPFQQTLSPLGHTQPGLSAMFPTFTGATATNAYLTVEQTNTQPTGDAAANDCANGCPAFFAYGSVLDNLSGDATTLEPQYQKALTDAAINCIYNATCKTGPFNLKRAVKH